MASLSVAAYMAACMLIPAALAAQEPVTFRLQQPTLPVAQDSARDGSLARLRALLGLPTSKLTRVLFMDPSGQRNCPMPVYAPDSTVSVRMPVFRLDSAGSLPMPIARSACVNPLFRRDTTFRVRSRW